jgi:hypothetical protein
MPGIWGKLVRGWQGVLDASGPSGDNAQIPNKLYCFSQE